MFTTHLSITPTICGNHLIGQISEIKIDINLFPRFRVLYSYPSFTTTMEQLSAATKKFYTGYKNDTPVSFKMIDVYLVYILFTGIFQFVYMAIVGTFPYNAFLGGFISTVGSFVLAGRLRNKQVGIAH